MFGEFELDSTVDQVLNNILCLRGLANNEVCGQARRADKLDVRTCSTCGHAPPSPTQSIENDTGREHMFHNYSKQTPPSSDGRQGQWVHFR